MTAFGSNDAAHASDMSEHAIGATQANKPNLQQVLPRSGKWMLSKLEWIGVVWHSNGLGDMGLQDLGWCVALAGVGVLWGWNGSEWYGVRMGVGWGWDGSRPG